MPTVQRKKPVPVSDEEDLPSSPRDQDEVPTVEEDMEDDPGLTDDNPAPRRSLRDRRPVDR